VNEGSREPGSLKEEAGLIERAPLPGSGTTLIWRLFAACGLDHRLRDALE
jgi:hypothetical protein